MKFSKWLWSFFKRKKKFLLKIDIIIDGDYDKKNKIIISFSNNSNFYTSSLFLEYQTNSEKIDINFLKEFGQYLGTDITETRAIIDCITCFTNPYPEDLKLMISDKTISLKSFPRIFSERHDEQKIISNILILKEYLQDIRNTVNGAYPKIISKEYKL